MAVASLVLGIIGLVIDLLTAGAFGFVGAILGIVGTILGAIAKKNQPSGMATAGLVLSILALVFGVALYVACAMCISSARLY